MIIPGTNRHATYNELENFSKVLISHLQKMSMRAELLGCELQKVDKDNKIFDPLEGVIDKKHLYLIRKNIATGKYEEFRNKIRIT